MADESRQVSAVRRVKEGLTALAAFARAREELMLERITTPAGQQSERLEELLRINKETMDEVKRILWAAEDDLLEQLENPP